MSAPIPPRAAAPPADAARLEAAREQAFRLLTDRYADDSLSVEQFEARLDRVYAAPDAPAVERIVADLRVPAPLARADRPPAPLGQAPALPALPGDERRIVAIMSETRRSGPWEVPRRLRVLAVMSEVVLDLRDTWIPDGCTIEVAAVMADVKILVAPELSVAFDVTPIMGSARSDATESRGYGAPGLVVRGSSVMAEVRVKARAHGNR